MCEPISIGIAIGAATGAIGAAVTGGDPLTGALLGGITGGITGGMGGTFGLGPESWGASLFVDTAVNTTMFGLPAGVTAGGMIGMAATGLAGSIGLGMLTPQQQDYNLANTGMPYAPQAYSSQHATVTGSGGRQAAAVLASEIKQAKKLRQRQAEVADFGLGMDITGTGLQIA